MIIILIAITINGTLDAGSTMIICVCNNVSDSHIRDAIAAGVCNMDELQSRLAIASQCGTCFESAEEVLFECLQLTQKNSGLYYSAA